MMTSIKLFDLDDQLVVNAYIGELQRHHGKLSHRVPSTIIKVLQSYLEKLRALIFDNGSGIFKAGFAQDDAPLVVFPSVVGRSKHSDYCAVGSEAVAKSKESTEISLKYPIEHGLICDWNDVESLWRHTFEKEVKVEPKYSSILMTEPPLNPKSNREKMTQIMFETFNVERFYVTIGEILSSYACGRTTSIVFSSGDDVSHTVPIYEGYCLPHAISRVDIAGRDVTRYLQQRLTEKGVTVNKEIVRDIKEKPNVCYVQKRRDDNFMIDNEGMNYELPDGRVINIGNERYMAPEIIFQPYLIGLSAEGLHKVLFNSIKRCDVCIRVQLYSNIIMAGGNTMFDGMPDRLQHEIKQLLPDSVASAVKIIAPPERKYSQWIGGSILASLSTFEEMWITREMYDEFGPEIVHRKCT